MAKTTTRTQADAIPADAGGAVKTDAETDIELDPAKADPADLDADEEAAQAADAIPADAGDDAGDDPYALVECRAVNYPGLAPGAIVWPMAKDVGALVARDQVEVVEAPETDTDFAGI